MNQHTVTATAEQEAFHQEFFETLVKVAAQYPEVRVLHIIAMLSKAVGRSIGSCFPHERAAMLKTAELNIGLGLQEFLADLEAHEQLQRAQPSPESKPS